MKSDGAWSVPVIGNITGKVLVAGNKMTPLLRRIINAVRWRTSFLYLSQFLPLRLKIQIQYFQTFGHLPNLNNPQTFNELIQTQKLSPVANRFAPYADKIAVKDFVRETIGDQYVIPTLYAGERLPPLDQRIWPLPFVIKASHGCAMNLFIREPEDLNWTRLETTINAWLRWDHSIEAGDSFYSLIKPQILVEPFMSDDGRLPVDYKFFVFKGETHCIQVNTDRETDPKLTYFDTTWNRMPFTLSGYSVDKADIPKPKNLPTMLVIASALGRTFDFVRVDLYEISGSIYFGELTFTPNGGLKGFEPAAIDRQLGTLWLARAA